MGFVRMALRNPYAVIVGVLAVCVLGLFSYQRLPKDLLPIFRTPAVQILTLYPGMPPEVVERDIMSRLQRWTGQSVGISHQEAKAMLGVCIVKDFFREDISHADAISQVTSLAMSDLFYLPPGTLPPMVMPFDPTASVPLCLLAVSSDTMSEKELYDTAYHEGRNRLQSIAGVVAPAVYGGVLRRILAYVDRDDLEARNLSLMEVVQAVQRSNPFVPTGSAKLGDFDYLVLSNAMVEEVEELNDTPIRIDENGPVFLGDVGEARDSFQIQSNIVRINGKRRLYVPIYRQPGANSLAIVDEVRSRIDQIEARIKEFDDSGKTDDLDMSVVMDQSQGIRATIRTLLQNGLFGILLVGLVVLAFLRSVRSTALVLVAIPIGLLGAGIGMFFTGNTLNSMTLGGLALSVGVLVDQAIVVTENISRHLRMGKTRAQAALDGAGEVALPVFVSSLTFVVVFFPVVFLTGMARYLFTPLAVAVTFAVATSYLVAMTFIPAAAARILDPTQGSESADRMGRAYRGLADACFRARVPLVAGVGVLFLLSLYGMSNLGTELFPRVDSGQFTILLRAPAGTRLERTEEIVAKVEDVIAEQIGAPGEEGSDLRLVISNIGVLNDWPAAYTPNNGPMDAFLLVQLGEDRSRTSQEWASKLREVLNERFAGIEFAFDTGGMLTAALNMGLPSPIDIQIQGSKLEVSHEIAGAVMRELRQIEGVQDARIAQPLHYPAIQIEVDRVKAAHLGLTQEDVIRNVAAALNSSIGFEPSFWIDPKNGNHYFIGAQYPVEEIESFETLENIPITGTNTERPVLLRNVAKISRTTSPVVVKHLSLTRTVDVFANVEGRDLGSVVAEIEERLTSSAAMAELMEGRGYAGKGYTWAVKGEIVAMNDSFGQFGFGLLIATILVFLVMVAQLRSFALPLVILLTVPLGLIGVVATLWMTGTHLSIPSFMGLILMVGLVVEYSILLVDFAVRRQRQGAPLREAILDAAETRLRPLLMTSLTTALALGPMAIGIGQGAEANVPLARAIIGAVLGGAFLTLFFVPALYGIVGRFVKIRPETEVAL